MNKQAGTKQSLQSVGDIQARKGEHIRLCLTAESQSECSSFSGYRLPYTALPEIALDDVDTSYRLLDKTLSFPFIIASMTGGSEHGRKINTNIAIAAETCGVALGIGSQRIGLENPDATDTFKLVRKFAPNTFIAANMGAVQLNYGHSVDSYRKVVDMVQADALYLHLNPLQEALQPKGDTDFRRLLEKISKVIDSVGVPVFIKEVGHGISGDVASKLFSAGAKAVDVAGVGGTSYAWIEAVRSNNQDFARWFKSYGIPTDQAVIESVRGRASSGQLIIASGGIRSPLDGLIARGLGADMFSAAVPFLKPALTSADDVIETLRNWQSGLKTAMFAGGYANWKTCENIPLIKAA